MQHKIIKTFSISLQSIISLPSIFAALLPKLICPLCWPAYAGLLSSFGISLISYAKYFLPATIVLLSLAIGSLAFRAKYRWGYKPFILGIIAAVLIVSGKFIWDAALILNAGIFLLISASVWNIWPKRKVRQQCSSCKTQNDACST